MRDTNVCIAVPAYGYLVQSSCVESIFRTQSVHLRTHRYLYVYVHHGTNTWDHDHHRMLASRLAPSRAVMRQIRAGLERDLDPLDLPPGPIDVMSAEGLAFKWHKRRRSQAGLIR